jgi:hypothetical protein
MVHEEEDILVIITNVEGITRLAEVDPFVNEQVVNIFFYWLPKLVKPNCLNEGQIKTIHTELDKCLDKLSEMVRAVSLAHIASKMFTNIEAAITFAVANEYYEQAHNLKKLLEQYGI